MHICPKCHKQYDDDEKFCDSCGEQLEELLVEYAVNRMLLAGGQVDLAIRLNGKKIRAAHVWQCMTIGDTPVCRYAECTCLQGSSWFQTAFNCAISNASIYGITTVTYHIGILFEDGIAFFDMDARHEIWANNTTPQTFMATINVNQGSLLKNVVLPTGSDIQTIALELNAQPPQFTRMDTYVSAWRPETQYVAGRYATPKETEKLTLLFNGFAVYVSAQPQIRMGRNPAKNDFAIMNWDLNTYAGDFPSGSVSREQLLLAYEGNSVLLYTEKESTLINDKSPGIAGNCGCPLDDRCKLSMGNIDFDMEIQHCAGRKNDVSCLNCLAKKVKAVTLKRLDNLPEAFVMVWECCDLSALHDSLKGYVLYRRNGGFILKEPSGTFRNLRTYMKETINNKVQFEVRPFVQRIIGEPRTF